MSCFFVLIAFTTSEAEMLLKADEAGQFQANLQNETLATVKTFFEQSYGIKFTGDADLFQTQITVSINNLSLAKTLKRIFSKVNVAFKYNSQGIITEVNLLPTNQNKNNLLKANHLIKNPKQQLTGEFAIDPNVQNKDDITDIQVEPNSPPSGDSFEVVPGAPPSFK